MRNPMYNKIPNQQIIDGKRYEPDVSEYDEFLSDYIIGKEERRQKVTKSSKTRQKKRNNRHAKEERLYGE